MPSSPVVEQTWNGNASWTLNRSLQPLFSASPRTGLVIGTFASVPYIHLQLEARKRFYPDLPLLVHDDGSHKGDELAELCQVYGCSFERNTLRQPPCLGDMTAFVGGLAWAKSLELELLVKASRRWLFLMDWRPSLQALAVESQYATFCSYTTTFKFGFRTECLGMAVRTWSSPEFIEEAIGQICSGQGPFVEGYLHDFARRFERRNCARADEWRKAHPMPNDRNGYALWTLMGTDRCENSENFLWHDSSKPRDYCHLASSWKLPYSLSDFEDPNQGAGNGR